jgi:molybdopterin synthase catalytic subunit
MTIDKASINTLGCRAVYLVLDWSFLGTWKHIDLDVTNGSAASEVRASKRLLKSESISGMRKLNYKVRAMLSKHSLNSLFRPGVYVVPLGYVQTVDDELQGAITELESIKDALKAEWQDIIEEARDRLGDLFDLSDYCSADAAANQFTLSYRYVPIAATPEILQHVAADTYQADLERSQKETEKELQSFRDSLRLALLGIIDNMRANLTKPDGEKRVFGKRFLKRLDGFLDTFATKNLSDDGALATLVTQLRDVANGVDVKALKESTDVQTALDTSLAQIGDAMAAMIEDEGRAIDLS